MSLPTNIAKSKYPPSFKPTSLAWQHSPYYSRSFYISLTLLAALWLLGILHVCFKLPSPVPAQDATPHMFSEERARQHIHYLASTIGQRVVGTSQELEAIHYILKVLEATKADPKLLQPFEIRLESGYGQHLFEIINVPVIKAYFNVTNIAVRFTCEDCSSNHSVIVNSHFDTIPGSTGAADAGTPIAVMLESVRMLSQSAAPLRNSIVFLFNGAEETLQDASHAFITQSDWFKDVAGVINLEAGGVGGKAMLFQAKNEMMLKIYSQVSYPHGSSLANDLFRTGLLISDTDYVQFMNHGRLKSGLDIAFYENSYFYHTRFDTEENLPSGTVQHMGQNTIDMLHYIAQSDSLDKLLEDSGPLGYFDFLGYIFISYSIPKARVFYYILVFLGCVHLLTSCQPIKLLRSLGILFKSLFFSLLFPMGLALCLHATQLTLSWYSNGILSIFLYLPPMFMGHLYARSSSMQSMPASFPFEFYEKQAQILLMVIEILVFSYLNVTGVFFFLSHLASLLFAHYFLPKAYFYHTQFLFPFCLQIPILAAVMKVFVPLAGRMGSAIPVELILPAVIWLFTAHLFFFFTPLLYRARPTFFRATGYFTLFFLLFLFLAVPRFTPRAPQRLILLHHDDPLAHVSELHLARTSAAPFPASLIARLDAWLGPHATHSASKQFDQLLALFPFSMLLDSMHWDMAAYHDAALEADVRAHLPHAPAADTRGGGVKRLTFHCHLNAHNMLTLFRFRAERVLASSVPVRAFADHTYVVRQTAGSEAARELRSACDIQVAVPANTTVQVTVAGIPRTLGRVAQIMRRIANMVGPDTDLLMLNAIVTNFTL